MFIIQSKETAGGSQEERKTPNLLISKVVTWKQKSLCYHPVKQENYVFTNIKVKRTPKENSQIATEPDFMNLMPNPTPTRYVTGKICFYKVN